MAALSNGRIQLLIALVAVVFFIPGLGAVHLFDWDEINFAEIAREMLTSGEWLQPRMGHVPFHEKPPLFIWLQALSMSLFGVNEFAARFPNALCGVITLLLLYRQGARWKGQAFGALWALAYFGSILPHLYFRSGIIDPWFNLFIFLGLLSIVRAADTTETRRDRSAWMTGVWLGLAVLTKGPVGILVPGICVGVYWSLQRFRPIMNWRHLAMMATTLVLVPALWFAIDLLRNGPGFIVAFFWRQVAMLSSEDAGHGGFFGYHFVVLLLGCFPASLFALQELLRPTRSDVKSDDRRRWMTILFWTVLLLFSLVQTKIVHYSSLCYFPLTYLAALQLHRIWERREGFGWSRYAMGVIGTLIGVVVVALPFVAMRIDRVVPLLAGDPFAQANMEADVHWSGWEAIAGAVLVGALIAAHLLHAAKRPRASVLVTFGGTAVFVWCTLFFLIRNIEGYSQRAAVEFFQAHADERCWPMSHGYKSYVPEFYGRITAPMPDEEVLLHGPIDRPVFLSCKVTHTAEVEALGTFRELYRKNGFVFFQRTP